MTKLAWMVTATTDVGIEIPIEFASIIQAGKQKRPPYYFLDAEEGALNTTLINRDYPSRQVIPIAKHYGDDIVTCIVVSDPERRLGRVIDVHFTSPPGYEVDEEFESLGSWARRALEDIEESIRTGRTHALGSRLDE